MWPERTSLGLVWGCLSGFDLIWFVFLGAAMCNLITYYRVDWVAEARKATGLQAYPEEDSEAVLELQPQDGK